MFSFPINDFVPFVTYCQSMFYMSTRFLKYDIYGVYVPQFQLAYIYDKNNTLHNDIFILFCGVYCMWWWNQ